MKWFIFKIGFRNVLKQRRRSLFNILALGVNTSMVILLIGVLRGSYGISIEKTIDLRTGHIQIHRPDYVRERRRLPLDLSIHNASQLKTAIEKLPEVLAASPRILAPVAVSNGRNRMAAVLYGVDPEAERKVGVMLDSVSRGKVITDSSRGVMIGDRLSELLETDVGQSLLVYAQTQSKSNNLIDAEVIGVFNSGFPEADRSFIFAPLTLTRELLDMGDEATEIVIRLNHRRFVPFDVPKIEEAVLPIAQDSLLVRPWTEIARDIVEGIKLDLISYAFIGIILVILAVFSIGNTMTVSVFERTAEIAALRALGMDKKSIQQMFIAEATVLGLFGTMIGWGLGYVLTWYLSHYGIVVPEEAMSAISVPMTDRFLADPRLIDWFIGAALAVFSALAGAVLPARRARKIPVAAALARGVR